MTHRILINYDTGNSFHHDEDQEYLIEELSWERVDVAKANLIRIKEHYEYNQITENSWRTTKEEREAKIEECKSSRWWAREYPQFTLRLKDDNMDDVLVNAGTWCGYFEKLNSAEVVADQPSDTKITF